MRNPSEKDYMQASSEDYGELKAPLKVIPRLGKAQREGQSGRWHSLQKVVFVQAIVAEMNTS